MSDCPLCTPCKGVLHRPQNGCQECDSVTSEVEATVAAHAEWVASGCPGALSHEEVMAELLGGDH